MISSLLSRSGVGFLETREGGSTKNIGWRWDGRAWIIHRELGWLHRGHTGCWVGVQQGRKLEGVCWQLKTYSFTFNRFDLWRLWERGMSRTLQVDLIHGLFSCWLCRVWSSLTKSHGALTQLSQPGGDPHCYLLLCSAASGPCVAPPLLSVIFLGGEEMWRRRLKWEEENKVG